ncbi:MAG: hypothetical protein U0936_15460 [Planctomycetaceae bacterium]
MPTTVNGVGTHYYGSKNKSTRTAVCRSCGRVATLTSYETRLWFVIVFIPVIPLGRKRITDQCSICSRHYVLAVKDWETARQTQTAGAMDQFRQSPSEETALGVHGTLLAFQQHEEATEFRRRMLERYPESALLAAGLAMHVESNGLPTEAAELWNKSYELDPELPDARVGLARHRMSEGKLDDARQLLSFLEEPGAEQQFNLEPLFHLSSVLQQQKRHQETLEIVNVLIRAFPDLTKDRKFRKFVKKSEKAAAKQSTMLPEVKHSVTKLFTPQYSSGQRWMVGLTIALILGVVGLAINNEYIRRHRSLTILNATGAPATVQIDGKASVTVIDKQTIPMAEGTHTVSISGPVSEQHTIDVRSGYWSRWFSNPAWLINVGGEGLVAEIQVYYAVHPQQPDVRILADPIVIKDHVDYLFEDAPESLELNSENSILTKTMLSWIDPATLPSGDLSAYMAIKKSDSQKAFDFAQRKLLRHPENIALLGYLTNDFLPAREPEIRKFLEDQLSKRPVQINWHRTYQDLPSLAAENEALVARYDAMLAADSNNAALLYLRGRIDPFPAEQKRYFQLSTTADPLLPWPDFAISYDAMCAGKWEEALMYLELAGRKGFPPEQLTSRRHALLMALGRYGETETAQRTTLQSNSADLTAAFHLAEALVSQDKGFEADEVIANAVTSFVARANGSAREQLLATNALRNYLKGDLARAVIEASGADDKGLTLLRTMLLIEQGEVDRAARILASTDSPEDRIQSALCSLGYRLKADTVNSDIWFRKAVSQYQSAGRRYASVHQILQGPAVDAAIAQFTDIGIEPSEKAVLLTLMGSRSAAPETRENFYSAAQKMLIQRSPPRGILEKVFAMETQQP